LREDLLRERSERREAQEEARRLREELEAPSKHDQSSAAPSALRGAWEEGAKEIARRLVAGIAGVVVFIPSALTAVISYFNNATTLAVLTGLLAFFATVTGLVGLVGTYFGSRLPRMPWREHAESRRCSPRSPTGRRKGTFQPILCTLGKKTSKSHA
jgi:hypothetical protein